MIKNKISLKHAITTLIGHYHFHTYGISHFYGLSVQEVGNEDIPLYLKDGSSYILEGNLIKNWFGDPEMKNISQQDFHSCYKNFIISEAFEYIKHYCNHSVKTNRKKFYNDSKHPYADPLNYLTILRNNLNHYSGDLKINWNGYKFSEVRWGNRIIREGMTGNEIGINFRETVDLLKELLKFIEEELE